MSRGLARRCYARMSATSRACRAREIYKTTRQTDERVALPQQTASRKCYEKHVTRMLWGIDRLVGSVGRVASMLRGS